MKTDSIYDKIGNGFWANKTLSTGISNSGRAYSRYNKQPANVFPSSNARVCIYIYIYRYIYVYIKV